MFTPPKHVGPSAFNSPIKKVPLNGLFKDGMWYCNCDPRLPASHFQVRKEGRNHGKWFYTCQESKEGGCGFFLWENDALGREMRSVVKNARLEPDTSKTEAKYEGIDTKWIRNLSKEDADAFENGPPRQAAEKHAMQAVEPTRPSYPETPRKAAKTSSYITPGSKRKPEESSLLTPATNSRHAFPGARSPTRRAGDRSNWIDPFGPRNPPLTPTPSRFRQADFAKAPDDSSHTHYDATEEVLELLKDQPIDEGAMSSLRELLNKQALRVSGIIKGRDITRVALKTRDAKIADLQQKITALESEREMDKMLIKNLKNDMAQSIASEHEGG